jgi:hypothetical protein
MSPTDPESIAAQAARGFSLYQCVDCAAAVRAALLAAGYHGEVVELRSAGLWPFMVSMRYDGGQQSITLNGRHMGVRVNDRVFDNLHPDGMPYSDWLADKDAPAGVQVDSTTPF